MAGLLIVLAVLAAAGLVATVREVLQDGYGRAPAPRSHPADGFAPPAARTGRRP